VKPSQFIDDAAQFPAFAREVVAKVAGLTPEQVGKAVVDLAIDSGQDQGAYLLTPTGLSPVG